MRPIDEAMLNNFLPLVVTLENQRLRVIYSLTLVLAPVDLQLHHLCPVNSIPIKCIYPDVSPY